MRQDPPKGIAAVGLHWYPLRKCREMTVTYDVLTYGDRLLRRKATPVTKVDDEVRALVHDLL